MDALGKISTSRIKSSISTQGNSHFHSKPGQPPFKQSGDLDNTIDYSVAKDGTLTVSAGDEDTPEAIWMEFGTKNPKGPIAPRPYMGPEMNRVTKTVLGHVSKYWRENFHI